MIELEHLLPEPSELNDYRRQNPGSSWDDLAFGPVRLMLRHQLNLEQEGLCVYCECLLNEDDGHIEHIQPKSLNPSLTFTYNNLAHSCDGPRHCGHHKKGQVLPIEPRQGCNRFFTLMALDGRLAPVAELTAEELRQANDTLRILGLNIPALAWQRKGYVETIRALSALESDDIEAFISSAPFRWVLRGL